MIASKKVIKSKFQKKEIQLPEPVFSPKVEVEVEADEIEPVLFEANSSPVLSEILEVVVPVVEPEAVPPQGQFVAERNKKIHDVCQGLMHNRYFHLSAAEAGPIATKMVDESASYLQTVTQFFSSEERRQLSNELAVKHGLK